jgi:hypothetical protein
LNKTLSSYLVVIIFSLLFIGCGGGSEKPAEQAPDVSANPIPVVTIDGNEEGTEGQIIELTVVASVLGGTIDKIDWVQTNGSQSILTNISTDKITVTLPTISDLEDLKFKVTVTDNLGTKAESTHDIKVNPKQSLLLGESCPTNDVYGVGVNSNISIVSLFDIGNVDLNKIELLCDSTNFELDFEIKGNKVVFSPTTTLPSFKRCDFSLEESAISNDTEKNQMKSFQFETSETDILEYTLTTETNITANLSLDEFKARFTLKHFVYNEMDYLLWINSSQELKLTSWNGEGANTIEIAKLSDFTSYIETFETTNDIFMFDDGDNKIFLIPTYYKFYPGSLTPVDSMYIDLNMITKSVDVVTRTSYFESSVQNSLTKINDKIYLAYRAYQNPEYGNTGIMKTSSDGGVTFDYTPYNLPENTLAHFFNTKDKVHVVLTNKSSEPGTQDYFSIADFNAETGELNELYRYQLPLYKYLFKFNITDNSISWCESEFYGGIVSDDTVCQMNKFNLEQMIVTPFKTFEKNSYNFSLMTHNESDIIFKLSYDDFPLVPFEIYEVGNAEPMSNGMLELDDGEVEDVYLSPTGLDVIIKRNSNDLNAPPTSDILLQKYTKKPTCS